MYEKNALRTLGCLAAIGVLLWSTGCGSDDSRPSPTDPGISDTAPPLAPAGLQITKWDDGGCTMRWLESAESDLAGYLVYVAETDTKGNTDYVPLVAGPLARASYVFVPSAAETPSDAYDLCVTAVDLSGNESGRSDTVQFQPRSTPPGGDIAQDPNVDDNGQPGAPDPVTDRTPTGVPGRNPSIEQPRR
ncbi:MAG: hypothetical protein KDA27_09275 [Candidatus Eisenbacteria bacterium]|uniref:Fibronectin type-III domain-containing protein n=1 Tax=Eiseniibacteriota bacterium TaxID=2212470 RepID=A0A956NB96_UNCEI|nr:hypothetical protein [Candidatus Eisenbacteria bacterium]MCB9462443.1 hypothetical protein [Candidatus Eisenbacteria bacterium]